MAWSAGWDLESRVDGVWILDDRHWLSFDLHGWTDDLSFCIQRKLDTISHQGVPNDVSDGYFQKHRRYVVSRQEELEPPPRFSWILVKDILELDWESVVEGDANKREEIEQWMALLRSLGAPQDHRVISELSR